MYAIDAENQLTDEEYYDASEVLEKKISYGYDPRGNRDTKTVSAGGSTLTTPDGDIPWHAGFASCEGVSPDLVVRPTS